MTDSPIVRETEQPSVVLRALWFLFIGWWATGIWLGIAWLLNLTIIGIPLGIKMINRVPLIVSLRRQRRIAIVSEAGVRWKATTQHGLAVRAIWFLVVGWWATGVWMGVAYLFTVTIVGLPIAVWMYGKLPFVAPLYRC